MDTDSTDSVAEIFKRGCGTKETPLLAAVPRSRRYRLLFGWDGPKWVMLDNLLFLLFMLAIMSTERTPA
eukprot:gene7246-9697_t